MTFPQFAGVLFGTVTTTAVLLGGLMYLINVSASSVRSDLACQVSSAKQSAEASTAQVGLTVRGMGDSVSALNTAIQQMQREQAADRVNSGSSSNPPASAAPSSPRRRVSTPSWPAMTSG